MRLRLGLLVCSFVATFAGAARAQGFVDQENACSFFQGSIQIQASEPVGQTFTPQAPNLIAIEVNLVPYGPPFSDTITLRLVKGLVTGPQIASVTRAVVYPPSGWIRFDFPTPVQVTSGDAYSFLLDATNPSWGWNHHYETAPCTYPGGSMIVSGGLNDGWDGSFRTYTLCGNGTLDVGEECDDGNSDPSDGCNNKCGMCGNGVVGPLEECDDGNLIDGDGCESDCTLTSCGDGVVQAFEECDDGPANGSTCCAARCRFKPAGRGCTGDGNNCTNDVCDGAGTCTHVPRSGLCDDGLKCDGDDFCIAGSCSMHTGNPCPECQGVCVENGYTPLCMDDPAGTACSGDGQACTADECDGAGACTHPVVADGTPCGQEQCLGGTCVGGVCNSGTESICDPCLVCDGAGGCVPPTGCQNAAPGRSTVTLRDDADPSRDSLAWTWRSSGGATKAQFGDPPGTTDLRMCVYDTTGVKLSVAAPAGGVCGSKACWREKSTGFSYRDAELTPDGIARLDVGASALGKGKIRMRGRGPVVTVPPLGFAAPVTVRMLRSEAPACWQAVYSNPTANDAGGLKAKSD